MGLDDNMGLGVVSILYEHCYRCTSMFVNKLKGQTRKSEIKKTSYILTFYKHSNNGAG